MNVLHIKKGDVVVVLSGAAKGKVGKVLATMPDKRRALVEGVNIVKKALRKSQDNPKGGIITKEAPLQVSKLMLQEQFDARAKKHGRATSQPS
jgi:large subunit ribosomal protein L24